MKFGLCIVIIMVSFLTHAEEKVDCKKLTTSEKLEAGCDTSVESYKLKELEIKNCGTMTVQEMIAEECNLDGEYAGTTALIKAAKEGNAYGVKLLIGEGVDIDMKDSWGNTALITAVGNGRSEIFNILLKAKADVNIKNMSGDTALSVAKLSGNQKAEVLLLSRMYSIDYCDYSYDEISEYYFLAKKLEKENSTDKNLKDFVTDLSKISTEVNYNDACVGEDTSSDSSPGSEGSH